MIRFKAQVLQAEGVARARPAFLVLPPAASAKLPTRNALTVEGTINGHAIRALLQPDGQKGHWLKLTPAMLKGAAAKVDDLVSLEVTPSRTEIEASIPADLRKALAAAPKARQAWADITPVARRDFIQWIITAKQAATRARRIANACDMLAKGKRRVCCFDSSGYYSKAFGAPKATKAARQD